MKNQSGELALIEMIRRRAGSRALLGPVASGPVRTGIGDDCAVLRVPRGHELLVTTDLSLERRHFRRDWHSPESIGHRCLARGLSDLAAMGGRPLAAFLSLALPAALVKKDGDWIERFFDGLLALADTHGVSLAGGDTSQSPGDAVLADIVLLGSAPGGQALLRNGARAGDALYVTGALGGAAEDLRSLELAWRSLELAWRSKEKKIFSPDATAELRLRSPKPKKSAEAFRKATDEAGAAAHPHLYPQPRLQVGMALLRCGLATACIDVSDGLSTDLAHLCAESKLCAEVDAAAIPIHPLARLSANRPHASDEALRSALHGGEDYELLFTAPAKARMPARIAGVPITRIGRMLERKRGRAQMVLIGADGKGKPLQPSGWEHFNR